MTKIRFYDTDGELLGAWSSDGYCFRDTEDAVGFGLDLMDNTPDDIIDEMGIGQFRVLTYKQGVGLVAMAWERLHHATPRAKSLQFEH